MVGGRWSVVGWSVLRACSWRVALGAWRSVLRAVLCACVLLGWRGRRALLHSCLPPAWRLPAVSCVFVWKSNATGAQHGVPIPPPCAHACGGVAAWRFAQPCLQSTGRLPRSPSHATHLHGVRQPPATALHIQRVLIKHTHTHITLPPPSPHRDLPTTHVPLCLACHAMRR